MTSLGLILLLVFLRRNCCWAIRGSAYSTMPTAFQLVANDDEECSRPVELARIQNTPFTFKRTSSSCGVWEVTNEV
jgi:hypothetical protein